MKNLKETIKNLAFAIADSGRILMVQTIIDYSGEELESKNDILEIAKETDRQLKFRLINIMNYYLDNDL